MEKILGPSKRDRLLKNSSKDSIKDEEIIEVNGKHRVVYLKKKFLGSGTFAKVYYCQKKDSKAKYAIKIVSKKQLQGRPEIKNQVRLTSCTAK